MTQQRDIERLLDQWFSDGPNRASDRVVDVVADRIGGTRQRPAWRLERRLLDMNPSMKVGMAAAAVVLIAVIGYNLLPGSGMGIGGPAATPSPTPTPTPSPTPRVLTEGRLEAGVYQTRPFASGSAPALTVSFSVPAGWQGYPNWAVLGPNGTAAPGGIGLGFVIGSGLYSDPCHWDARGDGTWPQPADITVGPTVDDLVTALRANRAYVTSAPTDVTIDGYRGKQLDLQLPLDVDPSTCDKVDGIPSYLVWGPDIDGSDLYAQGPGSRWHLRIVDVAGTRVIVSVGDYAGTSAPDQAAAQAMVDSIQFAP
jgi:hypothetical protein